MAEAYRHGMGCFVLMAQLIELLSTCIIYIVIAADLLQSCVPAVGMKFDFEFLQACVLEVQFMCLGGNISIIKNGGVGDPTIKSQLPFEIVKVHPQIFRQTSLDDVGYDSFTWLFILRIPACR